MTLLTELLTHLIVKAYSKRVTRVVKTDEVTSMVSVALQELMLQMISVSLQRLILQAEVPSVSLLSLFILQISERRLLWVMGVCDEWADSKQKTEKVESKMV